VGSSNRIAIQSLPQIYRNAIQLFVLVGFIGSALGPLHAPSLHQEKAPASGERQAASGRSNQKAIGFSFSFF
jgi:hypothetical protein